MDDRVLLRLLRERLPVWGWKLTETGASGERWSRPWGGLILGEILLSGQHTGVDALLALAVEAGVAETSVIVLPKESASSATFASAATRALYCVAIYKRWTLEELLREIIGENSHHRKNGDTRNATRTPR